MLTFDEQTHSYWVNNRKLDSVTSILKYLGLSYNYDAISSFYAERGKAVHKALEYLDKGTLDDGTLDPRVVPYVNAYRRFVKESDYRGKYWELPLYSESLGFAGTVDKVGTLGGRIGILDIKTSRSIDPALEPQLCAYTVLWNAQHENEPAQFKYGLQLKDDGTYSLVTKYSDTSVDLWLSILDVYKWKVKNKRV